ncbi:MAG: hypothetical protein GY899_00700 [Verrucomicrobiaceae bacterium]|nr:hypothetical protein [Verrucomicrobiaceae bacterium]
MPNRRIVKLCSSASIGSIALGLLLMLTALAPHPSKTWGVVTSDCLPQAILIAAGLIALAICGIARREE